MTDKPSDSGATASAAADKHKMASLLNYLRWFAAETEQPSTTFPFNADTSLSWFCQTLPQRELLDVLKARYRNLAGVDDVLIVFPAEHVLVEKVLIPLHQAKVAYVLGHELGCIALTGMVAEMLATLKFKISRYGSGSTALTRSRQERLFGRSFEQMEHSRRIGILEFLNLIDVTTADEFTTLSRIRNKYLHRLSESHEELAKDATRSYALAVKILGLGMTQSAVVIDPDLLTYIKTQMPHLPAGTYEIEQVIE